MTPRTCCAPRPASPACWSAAPPSRMRPSICSARERTVPVIRSVAVRVSSARVFTSAATTANPRPASPARAASMPALSERRRVCLAMLSMAVATAVICWSTGANEASRSWIRPTAAVSRSMCSTVPPARVRDSAISAPAAEAARCASRAARSISRLAETMVSVDWCSSSNCAACPETRLERSSRWPAISATSTPSEPTRLASSRIRASFDGAATSAGVMCRKGRQQWPHDRKTSRGSSRQPSRATVARRHRSGVLFPGQPSVNEAAAEVQKRAGQNAQHEHCRRIDADHEAWAERPQSRRQTVRRRIEVHELHDTQIVEGTDHGHHDRDDDETQMARFPERLDDPQLRPEADQRRYAGEGEHEHHHDQREQRIALIEALVVIELIRLESLAAGEQDHAESAERHEDVYQHVIKSGGVSARSTRDEPEHDESDVTDRGVREHALQVRLYDRHHIADDERQH